MSRPRGKVPKARVTATDDAGRVHLSLVSEGPNGPVRVQLDLPVFKETWQNELTAGAANTAYAVLSPAPSVARTVELGRNVMAAMSRLVDGLLARAPAPGVACRSGCDHCCYQPVGVTPPEALAIHEHLKATFSAEALATIAARVAAARTRTRGLTAAERFSPDHPCPFLEAGACSIYDARPLSCRGMNSLDADECSERLRSPAARAAFLARGQGGHLFLQPIRAAHAVSAGLQLALDELFGLDVAPLDLTAVMDLLLSGPSTLPEEWVGCGTPFAPARGADNSTDRDIGTRTGALYPPARS